MLQMYAKSTICSDSKMSHVRLEATTSSVMSSISVIIYTISLLILAHNYVAFSIPITSRPGRTPNSTRVRQPGLISDYIQSDEELTEILNSLREIESDSVKNPQNYISDDVPLEQLIAAIELDFPQVTTEGDSTNDNAATRNDNDTDTDVIELINSIDEHRLDSSNEPIQPLVNEINGLDESRGSTSTIVTRPTPVEPTTTTTTTTPAPFQFAHSDEEFDAILEQLAGEARDSIMHPVNYVTNDSDLYKIIEKIRDGEVEKLYERWQENRDLFVDEEECPICREELENPRDSIKLECNHLFHKVCLKDWFQHQTSRPSCPMCRRAVDNWQEIGRKY